jgi:hypothetical protein
VYRDGMKYRETQIVIEHKRKVYQGSYIVEHGQITVSHGDRQMVTRLGPVPPATLARMILREMVSGVAPEKIERASKLPW